MQRICKYPLLFKELMKATQTSHPDYENIKKAFTEMSNMLQQINEATKEAENLRKLSEIENSLNNAAV